VAEVLQALPLRELLEFLLQLMIRASEHLGKLLEPLAPLARIFGRPFLRISEQHPTDFLSFAVAFALAIALVALLVAAGLAGHIVLGRRRARVFISFQHQRETIADELTAEMGKRGIKHVKLPFVEDPDHDTLLDQMRDEIRVCDVFVCVPGSRPSFVESEVLMAFGLEKPLLFVVSDADTPRLPNTAKKGYPVFSLEQLQPKGFVPLINFCSYLAADWNSTVRLYASVVRHIGRCAILLPPVYLISLVIAFSVSEARGASPRAAAPDPHQSLLPLIQTFLSNSIIYCFVGSCIVLFLVPYGLFFASRRVMRVEIRNMVSRKQFSESFLPEILDYSLSKAELQTVLYRGDLRAEHEADRLTLQHGSLVALPPGTGEGQTAG
jgi:hypothetical protein